jgi:hypothetical protein
MVYFVQIFTLCTSPLPHTCYTRRSSHLLDFISQCLARGCKSWRSWLSNLVHPPFMSSILRPHKSSSASVSNTPLTYAIHAGDQVSRPCTTTNGLIMGSGRAWPMYFLREVQCFEYTSSVPLRRPSAAHICRPQLALYFYILLGLYFNHRWREKLYVEGNSSCPRGIVGGWRGSILVLLGRKPALLLPNVIQRTWPFGCGQC